MKYVVRVSGGAGSTIAAHRAVERYGEGSVVLVFADTNTEDESLYEQQKVLDYIRQRIADGLPPTVREIGEEFGIGTTNGVVCHLAALEDKGWIRRGKLAREIRIVSQTGERNETERLERMAKDC